LSQNVTNHSLYVNFRKIAIAESSLTEEIPNIFLRSIVGCFDSATRVLPAYKCVINVYVNWEKYGLKLLPTASVNFRKIAIAESSLTKKIPDIFLRSIVCYSASATRFLVKYKFQMNVYGNWEIYGLILLPTAVYTSIFVKSRSLNRLSVKKFQTFY